MKLFKIIVVLLGCHLCLLGNIKGQTASDWQIHEGVQGVIPFQTTEYGDPKAYTKMKIPKENDPGWKVAPKNSAGKVEINRKSSLGKFTHLDFTYFQTTVEIPSNVKVKTFKVYYDKADDGARIYFFNDKYGEEGHFDEKADLKYNGNSVVNINLADKVVAGKNRVVIVQFDNCGSENNLSGIHIEVNGEKIKTESCDSNPNLIGHWTFDNENDLKDKRGNFGDIKLHGTDAKIVNGALKVSEKGWASGEGYKGKKLKNKTLVAWVSIKDFNIKGGSVLTIDKKNTDNFDGIVLGEWKTGQWSAGSNGWERSKKPGTTFRETGIDKIVRIAISYEEVNNKTLVKIYRNNEKIEEYSQGASVSFDSDVEIIFGARHTYLHNGGNHTKGQLSAHIHEARIYDGSMCQHNINKLKQTLY